MKSVVVTDFVCPGISETFGMQGPWAHALLKVVKRCAKPRWGSNLEWVSKWTSKWPQPNSWRRWETKLVSYTVHTLGTCMNKCIFYQAISIVQVTRYRVLGYFHGNRGSYSLVQAGRCQLCFYYTAHSWHDSMMQLGSSKVQIEHGRQHQIRSLAIHDLFRTFWCLFW